VPKLIEITLAHSPDPDDVFMWWPATGMIRPPADPQRLAPAQIVSAPEIDTRGFAFVPVAADIAALNRHADAGGVLDITALSVLTFARVADRYALTSFGSSFGEGYGPKIVARADADPSPGRLADSGSLIAVPGRGTTAFLLLSLLAEPSNLPCVEMPFDRILSAVASGESGVTHGLLIHQSQLVYADLGLRLVADLGQWWGGRTGLPLPLGGNAIRRDLDERHGPGTIARLVEVLADSIRYALRSGDRSVDYCRAFAPELSRQQTSTYLDMYVSDLTLDAGPSGEHAIERLLSEASRLGLAPVVDASRLRLLRPIGPINRPR
jgi:1,4-dihydroxy-6-naphthoate synthase